jgi:hypothetical protein
VELRESILGVIFRYVVDRERPVGHQIVQSPLEKPPVVSVGSDAVCEPSTRTTIVGRSAITFAT